MLGRVSGTIPGATSDIGERARGVIPALPRAPLSILDASKQITDKLDSYQTGADYLSHRLGRRIYMYISLGGPSSVFVRWGSLGGCCEDIPC